MAKRKSWAARIEAAEKRGNFTELEKRLAASNWLTCAVGEKHGFPGRMNWQWDWPDGPEIEPDELTLGFKFGDAVQDDDIPEAKRLYAEIMALP